MTDFDVSKLRPEIGAGGYCRDDASVEFYHRINSLTTLESRVLDFGAGRSAACDGRDPEELAKQNYPFYLRHMRDRVGRMVGVDLDAQVMDNPLLDEAHVLTAGEPYPLADESFDLIYADWVIEHIEDIPFFASEIRRILAPGGWFCARTPNKWSYISIGSKTIGEKRERRILNTLQPWRKDQDAFPKFYRMNTLSAISAAFPSDIWHNCSYRYNPTPGYHGNRVWLFNALNLYQKLAPNALATTMMIFLQKH